MKKCSKCPFAINMGTDNYVEMACEFFWYHVPEEFDSKDHEGCNLKFSEAKKLCRLLGQKAYIDYESYLKELKKRRKKKANI